MACLFVTLHSALFRFRNFKFEIQNLLIYSSVVKIEVLLNSQYFSYSSFLRALCKHHNQNEAIYHCTLETYNEL